MARYVIAYAHPSAEPDKGVPLAVVAQDAQTAVIEAVPQDVMALARRFGLSSQAFVGWVAARRDVIRPLVRPGRDGAMETLPVTDVRWLHAFIDAGFSDTTSYGTINEAPGSALDVAREQARRAAADA